MIYLDTHVVVWLYSGLQNKLSPKAIELINTNSIGISPIVRLELSLLFQIKRTTAQPRRIINYLANSINLKLCNKPFDEVMKIAEECFWTRDPFDCIIVSQAAVDDSILITKDKSILENYPYAVWS